jgi:serine/threonine protein kinase
MTHVCRATDIQCAQSHRNTIKQCCTVALKVVRSLDAMKGEIEMRRGLNSLHVVGVMRIHVPKDGREQYFNFCSTLADTVTADQAREKLADQPSRGGEFVIVMKWASASLQDEMRMKRIAGQNQRAVKRILKDVATALRHLHENGVVHGDIKPRNIVTLGTQESTQESESGKVWALIDFDAASRLGAQRTGGAIAKYSEAFISPEYMKLLLPQRTDGRPAVGQPVIASSLKLDIWSWYLLPLSLGPLLCRSTAYLLPPSLASLQSISTASLSSLKF